MGQEHKERKPVEILLDEKRISDPAGVATAFKNYFSTLLHLLFFTDTSICSVLSSEPSLVFSSASERNIEALIRSLNIKS